MNVAIDRTLAPSAKVQLRHLILALTGAVAVALGIAIGATVFDRDATVDAQNGRLAAIQAVIDRPAPPMPDVIFYLAGSESQQTEVIRNVQDGEMAAQQAGFSGAFGRSVVLIAGTAEEGQQAYATIGESISNLNNPAATVGVYDLRK